MSLSQHITQHEIPHTVVSAIQTINGLGDLGVREYRSRIKDITGIDVTIDDKYIRHTYLYLIQEGIRNGVVDVEVAEQKARTFVDSNPWVLARHESETPKGLDAAGNPKQRKGAKKEQAIKFYNENRLLAAKENWTRKIWIEKLVEHVGLTPQGASTYYANLKAGRYK